MIPSTHRFVNLLALAAAISWLALLPLSTQSCGFVEKATEVAKEKAADAVEARAAQAGIDLKHDYPDVDPTKDDPRTILTKIIKAEVKRGNGELAAVLADVNKVRTLGDALAVVMAHKELLSSAGAKQEAIDAAKRAAGGIGAYALLATGAFVLAKLRGGKYSEALAFVMRKIEDGHIEGGNAVDIKDAIKNPNPHEVRPATLVSALAAEMFPNPTSASKAA